MMDHDAPADQGSWLCLTCWLVLTGPVVPACTSCGTSRPDGGWPRMPFLFRHRYELVRQLGRGGMGAVFEARDLHSPERSRVAVKVAQLKGSAATRALLEEAFRREGQAAGMLSQHEKYFVGFRGSDFSAPAHLVLDFIEWPTLDAIRRKEGTLSPADVASLGVEIARGIRCMERRRMVHRDLKPENVFARRTESGFAVKIADLGVWVDSGEGYKTSLFGATETLLAGTPAYMSPEQMRGEALTSASDVHMAGSILWELAAGVVPYPFHPSPALADALRERHERTRTPPERPPHVPEGLHRILVTALQFDPRDRFPSDGSPGRAPETGVARGMEKALEDFLAGHAAQQRDAVRAAREKVERARAELARVEPILAEARALIERSAQLHERLRMVDAGVPPPDRVLEEAERLSAAVGSLVDDTAAILAGASGKTVPLTPIQETERWSTPVAAPDAPPAGAARGPTPPPDRSGHGRGALAAAAAVAGALGIVLGAVVRPGAALPPAGAAQPADTRPTVASSTPAALTAAASADADRPPSVAASGAPGATAAVPSATVSAALAEAGAPPASGARSAAPRAAPRCGDGICQEGEGQDACCYDCCPPRDGVCGHGENPRTPDCKRHHDVINDMFK